MLYVTSIILVFATAEKSFNEETIAILITVMILSNQKFKEFVSIYPYTFFSLLTTVFIC